MKTHARFHPHLSYHHQTRVDTVLLSAAQKHLRYATDTRNRPQNLPETGRQRQKIKYLHH